MKPTQRTLGWVAAALLLTAAAAEQAGAIPAFARKYRTSCNTCHQAFPKLKEFGEEFAGNGFVWEGQEPSRAVLDTGDELLQLQREVPLAFRLDGYARFLPDAGPGEAKNDLQTPYLLKILSAAPITDNVAYYFYFFMDERGHVEGVEDAYAFFKEPLGLPVGAAVGQFQVSDPLFKRELRLSFEDYEIYRTKVGDVPTALTYDRGIMLSGTSPLGCDLFLEIVNGNGIGGADGKRQFDSDGYKNLFGRWSHGFGAVRTGAFAYWGKSEDTQTGRENEMLQVGPDVTVATGPLEVNVQYLWRFDDNPYYYPTAAAEEVTTHGGFAEVMYTPEGDRSRWLLVGLYNRRTSDVGDSYAGEDLEYQSLGLTYTYLLARNFRLMAEYNYDIEGEASRVTAGFASAF